MPHNYKGNVDPKNKLVQGTSISLDFAMLQSDNLYAPTELDAHVIELDGKYMDLTEFIYTFYPFDINMFRLHGISDNDKISFQHQTIKGFEFFLVDTILHFYRKELGNRCVDPSTQMMLINQLSQYRQLTDLCLHECSLSFSQIIETMMSQHLYMSNCHSFVDMFGSSVEPRYHHLVVSARFTNSNCKNFKDIIVKFNFIVGFKGEVFIADVIESLNLNIHVHHMPSGYNTGSSGALDYTGDEAGGNGDETCEAGDEVVVDECMNPKSIVNVTTETPPNYTFNGNAEYKSKYGLSKGVYIFQNIAYSNPIGILNEGKEALISYYGNPYNYVDYNGINYYHGIVFVNVKGDFGSISVGSNNPMGTGGENILQYTETCSVSPEEPQTNTEFGVGYVIRLQHVDDDGYFELQSDDNTTIYTRNGDFIINAEGNIVDKRFGLKLKDSPNIDLTPSDPGSQVVDVVFSSDGEMNVITYNESTGYSYSTGTYSYRLKTAYFYTVTNDARTYIRVEDEYFTTSHPTFPTPVDTSDNNPYVGFHGGIRQL